MMRWMTMLMRMFVANGVAWLGGWLDWVAKTLCDRPCRQTSPFCINYIASVFYMRFGNGPSVVASWVQLLWLWPSWPSMQKHHSDHGDTCLAQIRALWFTCHSSGRRSRLEDGELALISSSGGTGGPCAAANGSLYCGRLSSCTDSSRGISIYVSALTLVYQLALLAEFMKFSPQSLSSVTSKSRSNCFEISFLRSLLLSHHVARTVCNVSPTIQEFVRRWVLCRFSLRLRLQSLIEVPLRHPYPIQRCWRQSCTYTGEEALVRSWRAEWLSLTRRREEAAGDQGDKRFREQ